MNTDVVETEAKRRATEILGATPRRRLPLRVLTAIAKWWRGTRSEASLMNARDDMLRDIGLSRAEIEHRIGGRPYL